MNRFARPAVLAAVSAGLLAAAVAPASAATAAEPFGPRGSVAGYVVRQVEQSIDAGFVAPRLSCADAGTGVLTEVIGNSSRGPVGGAGLESTCVDGAQQLRAVFLGPDGQIEPARGRVRPGDELSVGMTLEDGELTVSLSNDTRGWGSAYVRGDVPGHLTAAFVGDTQVLVDGQPLAVAPFGTQTFMDLRFDGAPPAEDKSARKVLVGPGGTVLIKTSRLSGDGSTFTLRSTT